MGAPKFQAHHLSLTEENTNLANRWDLFKLFFCLIISPTLKMLQVLLQLIVSFESQFLDFYFNCSRDFLRGALEMLLKILWVTPKLSRACCLFFMVVVSSSFTSFCSVDSKIYYLSKGQPLFCIGLTMNGGVGHRWHSHEGTTPTPPAHHPWWRWTNNFFNIYYFIILQPKSSTTI